MFEREVLRFVLSSSANKPATVRRSNSPFQMAMLIDNGQ